MLTKEKVLQIIKKAKNTLGLDYVSFELKFVKRRSEIGKRAEIFIKPNNRIEIMFYPDATDFSVRHELCHVKLFKMGIPLTNTKADRELFPVKRNYLHMILIVEYYINELQRRFFNEYYTAEDGASPQSPPFSGLPELPLHHFSSEQINLLINIAKGDRPLEGN
jgi:hypothetical protein